MTVEMVHWFKKYLRRLHNLLHRLSIRSGVPALLGLLALAPAWIFALGTVPAPAYTQEAWRIASELAETEPPLRTGYSEPDS